MLLSMGHELTVQHFLHTLYMGTLAAPTPIETPAALDALAHLIAHPTDDDTHSSTLLSLLIQQWLQSCSHDVCSALRPTAVPATTLLAVAALQNIVWAHTNPGTHTLVPITKQLITALPPATTLDEAVAYHAIVRHIETLHPNNNHEWLPLIDMLLQRSPLSVALLPRRVASYSWDVAHALLLHRPVQKLLRNRLSLLLPPPETYAQRMIPPAICFANEHGGWLLEGLLQHAYDAWFPCVLALYETDCYLQQRGTHEHPTWPLLHHMHTMQRSDNPLVQRRLHRLVARYRPLAMLRARQAPFYAYRHLDQRFLMQIEAIQHATVSQSLSA